MAHHAFGGDLVPLMGFRLTIKRKALLGVEGLGAVVEVCHPEKCWFAGVDDGVEKLRRHSGPCCVLEQVQVAKFGALAWDAVRQPDDLSVKLRDCDAAVRVAEVLDPLLFECCVIVEDVVVNMPPECLGTGAVVHVGNGDGVLCACLSDAGVHARQRYTIPNR